MGSSHHRETAATAEFLAVFRAQADREGQMGFDRFMDLALYHPAVGYYRRPTARVGYGPGTDFFTASTSGPIFGELLIATCRTLLGGADLRDYTFVEIGSESPTGVLGGLAHPFGAARTIRLGERLDLSGRCVIFSNELFDAQPFRRFVFRADGWRELGVAFSEAGLSEVELPTAPLPAVLPGSAAEGYVIDLPLAAAGLAGQIAAQPWTGLFIACDYGKSWPELIEACPAGTARAYREHRQSNDLLACPGEQDLTCHICWDWLAEALGRAGFTTPTVESQEAFFVHHAGEFIAAAAAAEAARFSPRKQALLQLLHPSHLGQKFQVLHGRRG